MKNYPICSKVVWVIRILLGAVMLYFWIMKFSADADMIAFIWWAAHGMWLTFLSLTTWFWIATIGEILAWLMLLFGWHTKWGAILALIIMFFAYSATGWDIIGNYKSLIVTIASLVILFSGSGDWAICPEDGCCSKKWWYSLWWWGCCGGWCHDKDAWEEEIVEVE